MSNKLPKWFNKLNNWSSKYLTSSEESAGERIQNKTIEKANNADTKEERDKIYKDSAKSNLAVTGASMLPLVIAEAAPDIVWATGTTAGRNVLKKGLIDLGASIAAGEAVNKVGEKLTGRPTTGRFVLDQLGASELYDKNPVIAGISDIVTNPGYAMGSWAIKGATNGIASGIENIGNRLQMEQIYKNALKNGQLKFGEPTIYNGVHQSGKPVIEFQFPFKERWDVVKHGADPNGAFFTLDSPATEGFLSKRPYTSFWQIKSQKPLIQFGEITGPEGTKNNMRNFIVRKARRNGADAVEFRGIADNQLQNQNVLFATDKSDINLQGILKRGNKKWYQSPNLTEASVETQQPILNARDDVNMIIDKVSRGEAEPFVLKRRDLFGRETDIPIEWAAAERLDSAPKGGFDYFWRGTDMPVLIDPEIKTSYPALFGGNYDLVTTGYNSGGWNGGAPIKLSTDYIKDPNTLLLAVPKGTIKDLGGFNGVPWKYLHDKSAESMYKASQYEKLYSKYIDPNDLEPKNLLWNKIADLVRWFERHPFNFEGELANTTDDVAEILVELGDKFPYRGVMLRGLHDGGGAKTGTDVIYNFHKVAPKVVSPYSSFEFNWINKSFLKRGGKMKFQQGGVFSRFNFDKIYSNNHDDIKELQRIIGVKDDGMIGNNTIRALQRFFGTKDDGIWGRNSIAAAKNKLIDNISQLKSNVQSKQDYIDAGKAAIALKVGPTPKDYMPKTRTGNATASEVANERISTLEHYITDDIGKDVNYKLAQQVGHEKRPLVLKPEEFTNAASEYNKQWVSEGGNPNVISSGLEFYPLDDDYQTSIDRFNYSLGKNSAIDYTPATLQVNNISATANNNFQSQLTDLDRDQWAKEIGMNLTQMVELESQRQQAKVNALNAATPQEKQRWQEQERVLSDRIAMASNARMIKYDGKSKPHDPIPSEYMQLIQDIQNRHNETGEANLTSEEQQKLQTYYDQYGISPQYSRMPWREKYTLDHLHAAGYSYNNNDTSYSALTQKFRDANSGLFTSRNYNGINNGTFTMNGYRRGVTAHTNQLGDNIVYEFNTAPKDINNRTLDKPLFNISPSLAYDWGTGKFNVALSESGNYGISKSNSPLFNQKLMSVINNTDFSKFNDWNVEQKQPIYKLLSDNGFNIESGILNRVKTGSNNPIYDDNAVINIISQLQNASNKIGSEGVQSGNNSLYHLPMQQKNSYTSPVYGNAIHGIQTINEQPSTFTQDLYDFNLGKLSGINVAAFGPGTYYKTVRPLTRVQQKQLGFKQGGRFKNPLKR